MRGDRRPRERATHRAHRRRPLHRSAQRPVERVPFGSARLDEAREDTHKHRSNSHTKHEHCTEPRSTEGSCHYALGWTPRGGWLLAAGDGGTVSGPLHRAAGTDVDRRAVHTAAGFLHDLLQFASGSPPANVRPALLRVLGLERPGTPGFLRTLGWFARRGGTRGPAVAAPLDARWVDNDRIEVSFLPVSLEFTQANGAWIVTGLRGVARADGASYGADALTASSGRFARAVQHSHSHLVRTRQEIPDRKRLALSRSDCTGAPGVPG